MNETRSADASPTRPNGAADRSLDHALQVLHGAARPRYTRDGSFSRHGGELLYSLPVMTDMKTEDEVARVRKLLQAAIRLVSLSNREVERRMGFSNHSGYLSRLFHGSRELKLRQLLDILEAIGIPPANFFHAAYPHPVEEGEPARVQKALEHLFPSPAPPNDPLDE
jgi:hypothetical protein